MSFVRASVADEFVPSSESTQGLLRSELLGQIEGIVHGFTTRVGGVSPSPCASLNVGRKIGDSPKVVNENRRRALNLLGISEHRWISLTQVHGSEVVEVTPNANKGIQADGLWTRYSQVALAVTVADCVPLLFAHRSGKAVAAVHAGWRGTVAKIGAQMVERFAKAGFLAKDVVVSMGPAIGPCCFEVGPDVQAAISEAFPSANFLAPTPNGKAFVDLWELNRIGLEQAGILSAQIDILERCTFCGTEFFSYRREQGRTGRQCGLIARV